MACGDWMEAGMTAVNVEGMEEMIEIRVSI